MTKYRTGYLLHPDGSPAMRFQRYWEVQSPPYKRPLGYQYSIATIAGGSNLHDGTISYPSCDTLGLGNSSRDKESEVSSLCYGKFVGKLGESSMWANNLHEANQSISGAASRLLQIGRFASALRKGNIVKAAKILGTPVPKKLKGLKAKAKSFGDQFLEFHFGWVPLIQDVHSAMQTLSSPNFDTRDVTATAQVYDYYLDRIDDWAYPWHYVSVVTRQVTWHCKMGARVRISNPNAYLANQLGLVNPASIAWEAVPFSFVADWFGNVGQVLASATDFVGLEIDTTYTTTSLEMHEAGHGYTNRDQDPWDTWYYAGKLFKVGRSAYIASPVLHLKPFHGLSLTRGVTAISLLLQKLK